MKINTNQQVPGGLKLDKAFTGKKGDIKIDSSVV